MKARIIKTESDYEQALARIDALMDADPDPETDEGSELELLTMLVEQYEDVHFPMDLPSPVDAIKFRMEQSGLKQVDLIPYIGNKSKVSEVLSGKRPLSLNMIRKLQAGLGIPAEVLLQEAEVNQLEPKYCGQDFPINEMLKRGYFSFKGSLQEAKEYAEEILSEFFTVLGDQAPKPVFCRASDQAVNENALIAWQARILHAIQGEKLPEFDPKAVDLGFATTLAKLSYSEKGPITAVEFLNKKGIHVVFLSHLPKTYLDGACFLSPQGNPVIALTLRHDRLDNFWFTLMHELGHAHLHLHDRTEAFFDDVERLSKTEDIRERQANDFASEALIPKELWETNSTALLKRPSPDKTIRFAETLNIHSSIVAGRIRWERDDYKLLPTLSANRRLKKLFSLLA
jgi:HTH-type transcriptional regulator / antitoxin HigA